MTFKLCVGFVCVCVCAPTGEPGFLRGAGLQREMERLCYRERCTFCIQGTVTMVTYSHRGEVTLVCLFVCLFTVEHSSEPSDWSEPGRGPGPLCVMCRLSHVSQEDRCLFWTDRASPLSPSSPSSPSSLLSKSSPHPPPSPSLSSSSSSLLPLPSTPRSFRPPLSSSSSFSPTSSAVSQLTPRPLDHSAG